MKPVDLNSYPNLPVLITLATLRTVSAQTLSTGKSAHSAVSYLAASCFAVCLTCLARGTLAESMFLVGFNEVDFASTRLNVVIILINAKARIHNDQWFQLFCPDWANQCHNAMLQRQHTQWPTEDYSVGIQDCQKRLAGGDVRDDCWLLQMRCGRSNRFDQAACPRMGDGAGVKNFAMLVQVDRQKAFLEGDLQAVRACTASFALAGRPWQPRVAQVKSEIGARQVATVEAHSRDGLANALIRTCAMNSGPIISRDALLSNV